MLIRSLFRVYGAYSDSSIPHSRWDGSRVAIRISFNSFTSCSIHNDYRDVRLIRSRLSYDFYNLCEIKCLPNMLVMKVR